LAWTLSRPFFSKHDSNRSNAIALRDVVQAIGTERLLEAQRRKVAA